MTPKDFRFALGSAEAPRSALWRLWIQEDDLHLQVTGAAQPLEFTAYRTGRWRIESAGNVSRWTRPKEFRPGWIRGPDLFIPYSAVPTDTHMESSTAPITWLAPAPEKHVARFSLYFATPRAREFPWQPTDAAGTTRLVLLTLRTAGDVHLCRRDEPEEPEHGVALQQERVTVTVIVSADQRGVPSLRETHE